MQLPIDDRILEALGESQMILSPSVIAKNIDYSRAEVSRRLSKLTERNLVDKIEDGYYRITEDGEAYLRGEETVSE